LGIELAQLVRLRPYLYHLTARTNGELLRVTRCLMSASEVLREAGIHEHHRTRREGPLRVPWRERVIEIRDQEPLVAGNIMLEDGCNFADIVEVLNQRVYFWPGGERGPIEHGLRHFARYREGNPVVLRVPFAALLAANPEGAPALCAFNSGAPRCSGGRKSPRGRRTFLCAAAFPRPPSQVVEVTFRDRVALPDGAQLADGPTGPWSDL